MSLQMRLCSELRRRELIAVQHRMRINQVSWEKKHVINQNAGMHSLMSLTPMIATFLGRVLGLWYSKCSSLLEDHEVLKEPYQDTVEKTIGGVLAKTGLVSACEEASEVFRPQCIALMTRPNRHRQYLGSSAWAWRTFRPECSQLLHFWPNLMELNPLTQMKFAPVYLCGWTQLSQSPWLLF